MREIIIKKRFKFLMIIPLIILSLAVVGFGKSCGIITSTGKNSAFYEGFRVYNFFRVQKSDWASGQAPGLVWKPENVRYDKGKLILSLDRGAEGLTGGELSTTKKFGYGLYQVRMKPVKNSGVVSSFFNYSLEGTSGTEIDIEFLGYDTTKVQFNYYTDGAGGHEFLYDLGFDAAQEYHDYSFCWTKEGIYWYVDDILVHEDHENIPSKEAAIVVDVWTGDQENWHGRYDGKTPLYAYYDWISFTSFEDIKTVE